MPTENRTYPARENSELRDPKCERRATPRLEPADVSGIRRGPLSAGTRPFANNDPAKSITPATAPMAHRLVGTVADPNQSICLVPA